MENKDRRDKIASTLLAGILSNTSIIEGLTPTEREWVIDRSVSLTDELIAKLDEQ